MGDKWIQVIEFLEILHFTIIVFWQIRCYYNIIKKSQSPQATYSDDPETISPPPRWQKERGAYLWNNMIWARSKNYRRKENPTRLSNIWVEALSQIKDEDSVNSIAHMIDNPDAKIRMEAAKALGSIGTEYAKTYLLHRLNAEQDETVKTAIKDALHTLAEHH